MIRCPTCQAETTCSETRDTHGGHVRRRRICANTSCGQRVTTMEFLVNAHGRPTLDVLLVKRRDMETIFELARQATHAEEPELPPVTEGTTTP